VRLSSSRRRPGRVEPAAYFHTHPHARHSPASHSTAKLISAELRRSRILAVRPDVPGYQRDQFGQTWTDDHAGRGGHNGCDTRNDVLAVQLTAVQYRGRSGCVVIAGTLPADPYTGRRIEFRKAEATKVQIDHVYQLVGPGPGLPGGFRAGLRQGFELRFGGRAPSARTRMSSTNPKLR